MYFDTLFGLLKMRIPAKEVTRIALVPVCSGFALHSRGGSHIVPTN